MAQFDLAQLHLDQVFKRAVHGGRMGIFSKGNADPWSLCWASWNLPQSNDDSHAQGTHCKAIGVQIFQIPFSRCARPKRGHLFPGGIKIIQAIFLQISYLTQHFHRFEYHVHFIPNLSHPWKEHLSPLTFMTLWQLSFQYQTSRVPWTEAGLVQNPWSPFWKNPPPAQAPWELRQSRSRIRKWPKPSRRKDKRRRGPTFVTVTTVKCRKAQGMFLCFFGAGCTWRQEALFINSFAFQSLALPSPEKGGVGRFSWRFAAKFQEKPWPNPQPRQSVAWTAQRIAIKKSVADLTYQRMGEKKTSFLHVVELLETTFRHT